jgi:hypothetical protein
MALIGVSGKIASGKDTVGRIIQYLTSEYKDSYEFTNWLDRVENYKSNPYSLWQIKKFADKLKECISIITNISREDLEKSEVKNSNLPEEWNKNKIILDIHGIEYLSNFPTPITVRTLLQQFGTEVGRAIHNDFWVNALFNEYICLDTTLASSMGNVLDYSNCPYPNWIITDMRFPNEIKAVKDREGITIRLNRHDNSDMQATNRNQHSSEIALDNASFDYILDNQGTIEELIVMTKEILIKEKII